MGYRQEQAAQFAGFVKGLGFRVYVAKSGDYGFITDDTESRVLSWSVNDGGKLSGNYGPRSFESGTGWVISEGLDRIKTADDVRGLLYCGPRFDCGKGWNRFTTVAEYLDQYQHSSHFVQI
jgi:hypothetical protein